MRSSLISPGIFASISANFQVHVYKGWWEFVQNIHCSCGAAFIKRTRTWMFWKFGNFLRFQGNNALVSTSTFFIGPLLLESFHQISNHFWKPNHWGRLDKSGWGETSVGLRSSLTSDWGEGCKPKVSLSLSLCSMKYSRYFLRMKKKKSFKWNISWVNNLKEICTEVQCQILFVNFWPNRF